jgi:tetratricopeptide (TPR) repeat protein
MLETIREFALERLHNAGETEAAGEAHAAFFLEFVESQAGEHVGSYRALAKIDPLDAEIENIRLAIDWFVASGDARSAARCFIELYNYIYVRGLFREGAALGERVLDMPESDQLPARLHGRVYSNLSVFRTVLGDTEQGEALARRGLAVLQASEEDADPLTWSLIALVFALREQGRYADALVYAEQAHAASLPLNDPGLASFTRYHMGKLTYLLGDLEGAAVQLADALARSREIGPNETSLYSAIHLAAVRGQQGELVEAATCLHAAESVRRPAGTGTVWFWLDLVGALAAAASMPETAARLFAAYSADAASMGAKADWNPWIEQVRAQVREELGEAAFDAASREGQLLDLEDAAAIALEVLERIEAGSQEKA